jgi:hypothetical protein
MIKPKTKRKQMPDPGPKPTVRPKPTGPDYEGPYSIRGTAGPVNETVSYVRDIINRPSSPIPYQKKGGAMKKLGCAQCGKSMSKGGAKKMNLGGSAIKKAPTYMYGMPQENMGQAGQYGIAKKGGSTSVINRAVKPGCRGGMVKDANGNCVEVRKAKVGGSLKPVPTDKVGLSKLPTAVRNKMGFKKSGGMTKKEDGGPVTSRKLTRLGTKIEKKTIAGKTVGKGLQKRYDKAVDKVIVKGMTKKK